MHFSQKTTTKTKLKSAVKINTGPLIIFSEKQQNWLQDTYVHDKGCLESPKNINHFRPKLKLRSFVFVWQYGGIPNWGISHCKKLYSLPICLPGSIFPDGIQTLSAEVLSVV